MNQVDFTPPLPPPRPCQTSDLFPTFSQKNTKNNALYSGSSLDEHIDVMGKIAILEKKLLTESWDEKDLSEYGLLSNERFTVLANLSIPNGIFDESLQTIPQAIFTSFIDRLSLAAILLLDQRPEQLENLNLRGNTTFFFGTYVVSNFLRSEEFLATFISLTWKNLNLVSM